jgi:hypothetical protein
MTQDEVIKELHNVIAGNQNFTTWTVSTPHLVELVNRVVKVEREACADIAENWNCNGMPRYGVSAQIRARGQA